MAQECGACLLNVCGDAGEATLNAVTTQMGGLLNMAWQCVITYGIFSKTIEVSISMCN